MEKLIANKRSIQEAIYAQERNIHALDKSNSKHKVIFIEEDKAHIKTLQKLLGNVELREIRTIDQKLKEKRLARTLALYNNDLVFNH